MRLKVIQHNAASYADLLAVKRSRVLIGLALVMLVLGGLSGVVVMFLGTQPRGWERSLVSTAYILGGYISVLALCSLAVSVPRHRWLPWMSIVAGTAAFGVLAISAWWPVLRWSGSAEQLVAPGVTAVILTLAPLLTRALLAVSRSGALTRAAAMVTVVLVLALSASGIFALWHPDPGNIQFFGELVLSLLLLAATGGLATVMCRAIDRGRAAAMDDRSLKPGIAVAVRCPRCSSAFVTRTKRRAWCPGCRLGIRVQVEEPRCSCGYLLYGLDGAHCPECGRTVPADWASAPGGVDPVLVEPTSGPKVDGQEAVEC